MSADIKDLDELAAEFPGWTIWRSDTGRWWATRHEPISTAEEHADVHRMVDADTLDELSPLLADQEQRAAKVEAS
ncbi:hypothetical protein [Streptosporangium sp. NPDC049078]|uniref:hypothetical protein n=1 Tax=Streptosporangium sp. NPDC049078 TaxID=3155767 RepID=UPI00341AA335